MCKLSDGKDWWWVELGVALVGRAQLNFNPLVCCWVGLSSLPVGCLALGDPALEPTGSLVWLMVDSGRAQGVLPRTSAASILVPAVSHSHPPPL